MLYRPALDVLHHQVRKAILSCAAIEKAGDILMVEIREYLTFISKAAQDYHRIHSALNQLDCDLPVILIIIADGQINRAHASASDFVGYAIGSNASANQRFFSSGLAAASEFEKRLFHEVSGRF